ncbi:hypothetical protein OAM37_03065 [bacterium]|nr:hypothetical protein [Pseudomonadales bacterium]MDB4654035.1 hypothetical protein [bacterium]MDC0317488.1 hypothetical protein [bacterium]
MTLVSSTPIFRSALMVVAVLTTVSFKPVSAQESQVKTELELPESWAEFVESAVDLGNWSSSGVTGSVWESIPAGIQFTSLGQSKVDETKTRIVRHHAMRTADGKIISSGGGQVYWDADSKKVRSKVAGFDFGKPYHGESEYQGLDSKSNTEHWKHSETSQGKTTEYLITVNRYAPNSLKITVAPIDGSEPWVMESTRVNPLAKALEGFDHLGTWVQESEGGQVRRDRIESILDGRAISITDERQGKDGEWVQHGHAVITWDPTRQTLIFRGATRTGFTYQAIVESITFDGQKATMVTRGEGTGADGSTFMARLTRVIDGDTMTFKFHNIRSSNSEDDPDWVSDEVKWTRMK